MSDTQLRGKGAFPMGNDLDAVAEVYGDPAQFAIPNAPMGRFPDALNLQEGRWRQAILAPLAVPFPSPIRYSGTGVLMRHVYPHRLIRESLVDVLSDLMDADAWKYVTDFAGCYNYRARRGGSTLSEHSWGIALDFNAERYPLGSTPDPTDPFVTEVIPIFKRHGWTWGGDYSGRKDPMHVAAVSR